MQDKKLSEIIEIAIKREEEAYDFYIDLKEKVIEESAKDAIDWIAGEEKKHREFLVNYRDGGQGPEALRMSKVIHYNVAEHLEEPTIQDELESQEVFLIAAHRELKSYKFYMEFADLHAGNQTREMLLKIANEELKHKEKMEYLYANTAFPQTSGG